MTVSETVKEKPKTRVFQYVGPCVECAFRGAPPGYQIPDDVEPEKNKRLVLLREENGIATYGVLDKRFNQEVTNKPQFATPRSITPARASRMIDLLIEACDKSIRHLRISPHFVSARPTTASFRRYISE